MQRKWIEKKWIDLLRKEALFLYKPYGRSGFYIFVGLLVVAKGFHLHADIYSYSLTHSLTHSFIQPQADYLILSLVATL